MKRFFYIISAFLFFFLLAGCKGYDIGVVFDDVNGLKKNDPVFLENERAGVVKDIKYTDRGDFLVSVRIKETAWDRITQKVSLHISTADNAHDGEKRLVIVLDETGGNPLKSGAVVKGSPDPPPSQAADLNLTPLFEAFERSLKDLAEDLEGIPETEQFKRLEKAVARLAQKMKTAGSNAREKIVNEIVPRLKEKIEQFERRLEKEGKKEKKEEIAPLKEKLEAIQKV